MNAVVPKESELRKVLLLSSDEVETAFLQEMLNESVTVTVTRKLSETLARLDEGSHDVFFCDWRFGRGTWREALERVQDRDPLMPAIVILPAGEEYERLEVLEAGAFDLLALPWRRMAVIAVLEHALASRDAQLHRSVRMKCQHS